MAVRLTLRDLQILEFLSSVRYAIAPQIQVLFWGEGWGGKLGPKKACERRLRLLHRARLVRRIEQPTVLGEGTKHYIYTLDKAGAWLLVSELGLDPAEIDWQPKPQEANYPFLDHLLATTDFRIALQSACQQAGTQVLAWEDEKALRSEGRVDHVALVGPLGQQQTAALIPDALFWLDKTGRKGLFFVEIDKRTVTVKPTRWEQRGWSKKVRAYLAYRESEAYRNRYGPGGARVLTITTGEKRLSNLKAATEEAGGSDMFWFTTFAQALDPAQLLTTPIWAVATQATRRRLLG